MIRVYSKLHNCLGLDCELDIQRTTHTVRSFRPGLVQSEAQYQFIYTAINHYVQTICSRISAEKVCFYQKFLLIIFH